MTPGNKRVHARFVIHLSRLGLSGSLVVQSLPFEDPVVAPYLALRQTMPKHMSAGQQLALACAITWTAHSGSNLAHKQSWHHGAAARRTLHPASSCRRLLSLFARCNGCKGSDYATAICHRRAAAASAIAVSAASANGASAASSQGQGQGQGPTSKSKAEGTLGCHQGPWVAWAASQGKGAPPRQGRRKRSATSSQTCAGSSSTSIIGVSTNTGIVHCII